MKRAYEEIFVCTDLCAFFVHYLFFSCFFIYFFLVLSAIFLLKVKQFCYPPPPWQYLIINCTFIVKITSSMFFFVQVGDAFDDVHVCIMCLRAIMNHQHGFNLVIAHPDAINSVALALKHKSTR